MTTLLLAALLVAPPWTRDLKLTPRGGEVIKVKGAGAPRGLVLVPPGKSAVVEVQGPGALTLRLHAILLKRGVSVAGAVLARVDDKPGNRFRLGAKPIKRWKLTEHPLFALSATRTATIQIGIGHHRLRVIPGKLLKLGIGFSASFAPGGPAAIRAESAEEPSSSEPPLAGPDAGPGSSEPPLAGSDLAPVSSEPPLAGPDLGPGSSEPPPAGPVLGPGSNEPPLAGPDAGPGSSEPPLAGPDAGPGSSEPSLASPEPVDPPHAIAALETSEPVEPAIVGPEVVANAAEASAAIVAEGYSLAGVRPPVVSISGPGGVEPFYHVDVKSGLALEVSGPGVISVTIHAHRARVAPMTLEPVIVAIMMDQVLLKTVSLTQPSTDRYRVDAADYRLATRTMLRIPIQPGAHRLHLTLSENAVRGISMRPRFDPNAELHDGVTLTAEKVALTAYVAPPPEGVRGQATGGLLVGVWLPKDLPTAGLGVTAEGKMEIPIAGPSLALGVMAGFCYASQSRDYADPRTATGRARVDTEFLAVPLSIDARFSAAAAAAGIEIGVGGGVLLSWATARALGTQPEPELRVRPAGIAHLGGTLALGPGHVIVRLTYLLGQSFSARTVRKVSMSGAHAAIGYRLGGH